VKCAVVTSTSPDIAAALDGLIARLQAELGEGRPDLLVVFFTPHHGGDVPLLRKRLLDRLKPRVMLGCPAAGIIGENVEIEEQAGIALWAARFPGCTLTPFQLGVDEHEGEPTLTNWPADVPAGSGFLVLADPYTTPGDALLEGFAQRYPGMPVIGGMASGTQGPGQALFLTNDGVHDEGVIGVAIGGSVRIDPLVSQGCRPIGSSYIVTAAEGNVIRSLAGAPPLERLRDSAKLVKYTTLQQQIRHTNLETVDLFVSRSP